MSTRSRKIPPGSVGPDRSQLSARSRRRQRLRPIPTSQLPNRSGSRSPAMPRRAATAVSCTTSSTPPRPSSARRQTAVSMGRCCSNSRPKASRSPHRARSTSSRTPSPRSRISTVTRIVAWERRRVTRRREGRGRGLSSGRLIPTPCQCRRAGGGRPRRAPHGPFAPSATRSRGQLIGLVGCLIHSPA